MCCTEHKGKTQKGSLSMPKKKTFRFSEKWNLRFMDLAKLIAGWSKDDSTKVGCVIIGPDKEVRSMGYNGFPRGVDDTIQARKIRPTKYDFTEHAERNAIYNAGLYGASVKGCSLYVTLPPCADCARGIIQSGISEIIYLDMPKDDSQKIAGWRDKLNVSFEMFDEAGIIYKPLNGSPNRGPVADCFATLKIFDTMELNQLSDNLIRVNGRELQSYICTEETNELISEMILNNSFYNIAQETADFIITRNHVVRAYDIGTPVCEARAKKLLSPNFAKDTNQKVVALLDFQKSLIKYVNRNAATLTEITNKIANADVAIINSIIENNNLPQVKQAITEKIKRTIEREFIKKSREYK